MNSTRPDIHEYTLPAYWASYLINGDDSGLDAAEKAVCDGWLSDSGLSRHRFMDCGEQFFSSRSDRSETPSALDAAYRRGQQLAKDGSSELAANEAASRCRSSAAASCLMDGYRSQLVSIYKL